MLSNSLGKKFHSSSTDSANNVHTPVRFSPNSRPSSLHQSRKNTSKHVSNNHVIEADSCVQNELDSCNSQNVSSNPISATKLRREVLSNRHFHRASNGIQLKSNSNDTAHYLVDVLSAQTGLLTNKSNFHLENFSKNSFMEDLSAESRNGILASALRESAEISNESTFSGIATLANDLSSKNHFKNRRKRSLDNISNDSSLARLHTAESFKRTLHDRSWEDQARAKLRGGIFEDKIHSTGLLRKWLNGEEPVDRFDSISAEFSDWNRQKTNKKGLLYNWLYDSAFTLTKSNEEKVERFDNISQMENDRNHNGLLGKWLRNTDMMELSTTQSLEEKRIEDVTNGLGQNDAKSIEGHASILGSEKPESIFSEILRGQELNSHSKVTIGSWFKGYINDEKCEQREHQTDEISKSSGILENLLRKSNSYGPVVASNDYNKLDEGTAMHRSFLGMSLRSFNAREDDIDFHNIHNIATLLVNTERNCSQPESVLSFDGNVAHETTDGSAVDQNQSGEQELASDQKILTLAQQSNWTEVSRIIRYQSLEDMTTKDQYGLDVFLYAVKDSKIDVVNQCVAMGANILSQTNDGRSAAHIAAMYGNEEMIQFTVMNDYDFGKKAGPRGQLPLHYACTRASARVPRIVTLILQKLNSRLTEDMHKCFPIYYAVQCGNSPVINILLNENLLEQIEHVDENLDALIHVACRGSNDAILKMLLDTGAINIDQTNSKGWSALHEVAYTGNEQMLKVMHPYTPNADIRDQEDRTPLHIAAERGHTKIVEALVDKFSGSVRARTRDGSTLLHVAALSGHADTALAFLKRGVPLHMPNKTGALGLHSAAAAGFSEVMRVLIARGTHIDTRTKDNYTALHVAVQYGRTSAVETLLGYGADVHVCGGLLGETALHFAAALNVDDAVECAHMLLKSGAQPNVARADGETALHIAARNPLAEMTAILLMDDADPRITSQAGETALHVASKSCNSGAVILILEHLSHILSRKEIEDFVNTRATQDGLTAVHYAAEVKPDQLKSPGDAAKLINALIDYGGKTDLQTLTAGDTTMHLAARSGNEAVLLAVVDKIGAGAVQIVQNKQSKTGWSPLLEACARGHQGVVRILLKHHARIDVFDENGQTALHLAAANGHLQLANLLLQNKAFVNSKSKLGEAPLHLAAQNGHVKVVNLLIQDHGAAIEAITLDNQTVLHYAARYGQLAVAQSLLALGANPNARDDKGQTPLHLSAENDYPDVVKLFLKMKQNNRGVLTAIDHNGFTCAHIAAMKGSLGVVKELMMIDKAMVIQAKTKTMEATTLHMAAAGGHDKIVKILLENGADGEDENAHGMTALHVGAKNGYTSILEVFDKALWKKCSRKTGLNALHIAAYYGNSDFVNEMLKHVPASSRSEPPIYNHHVVKEFSTEYGFTPLHLAAQSGHDSLVRMLLNQGVQVDATSTTMSVIPLHLAAQQGHIAVVGMLLSRSTQQQHAKDWRGRTPLHLASMNGHYEMVSLLIAQGSNINVMDQNGWTGMHYATKAGHINIVKLFVKSSADAQAETKEGKVPLCFAAAHNHADCLRFLLKQNHDTHALMEDRKFIFDLMVCGKTNENEPLKEFILHSPAPIDTAVKLSSLYREMSEKEKERARDLSNVSEFAEGMAVELLSIAASEYNAALLLKAKDNRGRPLLDVLIENEQKEVVSYASVQRYLTEIWTGRVDWSFGKTLAFALIVFICPPAWFYFSLPLDSRIGRAPIIKFVCHIVSHVYFTILLTIVVLNITHKIYDVTSVVPNPVEWLLLLWLSGNLVSELSNIGGGSGLGIVKVLILILSAAAIAVHVLAFLLPILFFRHFDSDERLHFVRTMLYLKNQLFAFGLLFAFVEFLDFLTVHHLFGPWAIIIRDLMYDLTRFLVILMLFIAGFTLHVTSIFQPAYKPSDEDSAELMRLASPAQTLEMLFFSLFGLVEPDSMPPLHLVPDFAKIILKLIFGIYLLVTLIVLINLLIAMMSDTYQRIQAQSDKEWKFGRAILIRQMNKRSATPAPINMLTKLIAVLRVAYRNKLKVCTQKAQQDLRYEEDIDAFSMNGDNGRASPAPHHQRDETGIRDSEEIGKSRGWNIESIVDWKRIVGMYYRMNGTVDPEDVQIEAPAT